MVLINLVINQIIKDLNYGDTTPLEELLNYIPADILNAYLSEVGDDSDGENIDIQIDDISHINE